MDPISLATLLLLWAGGLCAGFVDSIAGGGGMIAVPVLLTAGLPPHLALGTNKLQSSFGSFTAALNYSRKGLVQPTDMVWGVLVTFIAAAAGTIAIQLLSATVLRTLIPVMLVVVFLYTLFSPELGYHDTPGRLRGLAFYLPVGLLLGFYDGFFGPGTGSFWALAFVMLMGYNLKKATAHTKITNFTSNLAGLIFFLLGGKVVFTAGITMGIGQVIGAYLGSRLVILRGVGLVRFFLLTVVGLTILKLILDTYGDTLLP
ncbi:MAG: TSUP family transporter [Desulfosarcinaceae bacterium]|nr:TSUP family transporter [Desulfosarcinaceae bacterium]